MTAADTNFRSRRARGHSAGGVQMRRIAIGFDAETFADIAASASALQITFAERVRELVELGRETEQQEKAAPCSTPANGKKATSSATSRS
jgi:hypothetical protein